MTPLFVAIYGVALALSVSALVLMWRFHRKKKESIVDEPTPPAYAPVYYPPQSSFVGLRRDENLRRRDDQGYTPSSNVLILNDRPVLDITDTPVVSEFHGFGGGDSGGGGATVDWGGSSDSSSSSDSSCSSDSGSSSSDSGSCDSGSGGVDS